MFERLAVAPPDPVFGLLEDFRADNRPHKVNLTVGVYQDETGQTPVMQCVAEAERRLAEARASKAYLPIDGAASYNRLLARLVLGEQHPAIQAGRTVTLHTPGGTGALRIAADLIVRASGKRRILMSDPTWANHPQIFTAAGLEPLPWRYLNPAGTAVDVEALLETMEQSRPGDAILLHTVCHNPTGFDWNRDQWRTVLDQIRRRELVPIFDFAYQGFGRSIEADAEIVREFCSGATEAFICSSFSKNLGLYAERVGSLTVVSRPAAALPPIASQCKSIVRTMYSTPPAHGGRIVELVLGDPPLRESWLAELATMRERIDRMRTRLVAELAERVGRDEFAFVAAQRGMFSYSGLSADQARQLRDDHAVYIVDSGRINVAGLNEKNLDQVANAIAAVVPARV